MFLIMKINLIKNEYFYLKKKRENIKWGVSHPIRIEQKVQKIDMIIILKMEMEQKINIIIIMEDSTGTKNGCGVLHNKLVKDFEIFDKTHKDLESKLLTFKKSLEQLQSYLYFVRFCVVWNICGISALKEKDYWYTMSNMMILVANYVLCLH